MIDVLDQLFSAYETDVSANLSLVVVLPKKGSRSATYITESFGPGVDLSKSIYRSDHPECSESYIIRNLASDSRTIISYDTLPNMTLAEFTAIADSLRGEEAPWYHFEVSHLGTELHIADTMPDQTRAGSQMSHWSVCGT